MNFFTINKNFTRLLSFVILFISFQSCSSLKPGSTNSSSSLYASFFVGEEGTQYFVKPLQFKTETKDDDMQLDITFQYKDSLNTLAIINYSLINQQIIKNIDSLIISTPKQNIICVENKRLYNERKKNNYFSRFSTQTPAKNLKTGFTDPNWTITTYRNKTKTIYQPSKKTKRSIQSLNEYLFVLFD